MKEAVDNKQNLYATIRKEVEDTFGRKITTSGDCNMLCEDIFTNTGSSLNANTLRRFYGLVKAQYPASLATLNILAGYCGYQSAEEMQLINKKPQLNTLQEEDVSVLYYFINLFKAIAVTSTNDDTFLMFISHTINFLQKKPGLIDKFQRAIVKTKNGQQFYFEHFVNTDKLTSFFGAGLRYYINENKTAEGQIFGYSLLCKRDWLAADNAMLKKNFEYMMQQYLPASAHPSAYGRYMAAKLFYADIFESGTEQVLREAYTIHEVIKSTANDLHLYNCYEQPLCYALILTGHNEEAMYYINYAFTNYEEKTGHLSQKSFQQLSLLKAMALCKMNVKSEAEAIFAKLNPSKFYFLSKKFNTVLYLLLAADLKKITKKQFSQFTELIKETKFRKLNVLAVSYPHVNELKFDEQN